MTRIVDLTAGGGPAVRQAAELLLEPPAFDWQSMDSALEEVRACVQPANIARMAVDHDVVAGWIGAQKRHEAHIWELHPLVVRSDRQRQGIGRALVADLEEQVRAHGGTKLFVGADNDLRVERSTAWSDLYANLPERLGDLDRIGRRQYEFYERCGYVIVGVVPGENGSGNIYMGKRIAHVPQG